MRRPPVVGVLAALLAALLALRAPGGPLRPAAAGPVEAREAYRAAQQRRDGPWREHVRGLRAARALTHDRDPLVGRALLAEAQALRRVARVHGAAAAETWAARRLPASDPDRAAALLSLGRGLRADGDDRAAQAALTEAAEQARTSAPERADDALDLLVDAAAERRDLAQLTALCEQQRAARARTASRLAGLDALGCLRLARGDRPGAEAALAAMQAAFATAPERDPREQARAAKAWLDARLRRLLRPP